MIIIVCGGRDYKDETVIWATLDRVHDLKTVELVIHGGATGADSIAGQWAATREIDCLRMPAKWNTEGRAVAGPERNKRMLEKLESYGWAPDRREIGVVAFPGGRGTAHMCRLAEKAGVTVWHPVKGAN